MAKRSKHSVEFKLKMVQIFKKQEYSYGEMAELYQVPKTTMQRWVVIYENEGAKGFEIIHKGNSNGNRPKAIPKFEPKKNETLEKENERLRAENAYLKKLNALVQEKQLREQKHKRSGN